MRRLTDYYEESSSAEMLPSVRHVNAKQGREKKLLKAPREVDDIREQRRLKRQLDPRVMDYLLP